MGSQNPKHHTTQCLLCRKGLGVVQTFEEGYFGDVPVCLLAAQLEVPENSCWQHIEYFGLRAKKWSKTLPHLRNDLDRDNESKFKTRARWLTPAARIKALELHAKLNGELSDAPQVNVMVQNLPPEVQKQVEEALTTGDVRRLKQLAGAID